MIDQHSTSSQSRLNAGGIYNGCLRKRSPDGGRSNKRRRGGDDKPKQEGEGGRRREVRRARATKGPQKIRTSLRATQSRAGAASGAGSRSSSRCRCRSKSSSSSSRAACATTPTVNFITANQCKCIELSKPLQILGAPS